MGCIGGDGRAAGEVAGDGFPYGEEDVGGESQPEDLLRRLAAILAVVVGVAPVFAGGDEPVAAALVAERGEHAAGAGWGEVWRTAGGGSSGDAAGEVGEAEAHSRKGERKSAFVLCRRELFWFSGSFVGWYSTFVAGLPLLLPVSPATCPRYFFFLSQFSHDLLEDKFCYGNCRSIVELQQARLRLLNLSWLSAGLIFLRIST